MSDYTPPDIPAYPEDLDSFYAILKPYYAAQRPLELFFELLVLDVLGCLPEKSKLVIDEFSKQHPTFFEKTEGDWEKYVRQELKLSGTIDVAILDLWIRNSASAKSAGWDYHPWHYATNFIENYFAEDSKVDVWPGNSLEEAQARIARYKNH